MESPVVVDKPPEYHGSSANSNDRGFPFDEEEGTGAWSELAARHPDIAARLRQRPATWARKRRPSSQDAGDDFGDNFGFDRFPFDDIPPEFREHFPSHWNRRYGPRDEPHPPPQPQPHPQQQPHPQTQQPQSPQQQTTATQTERAPGTSEQDQQTHLPQYGLRNTVDLGQKSPADPSLVDADDRNQRSMSAPPDSRAKQNCTNKMSGQNNHDQQQPQAEHQSSNVRHIPIFVEGRDEPVINKNVDHGASFCETKPTYVPPPQQPHIDREQYFADDGPASFHHPPNFSRAFGTPFNKGFRQGPQPFVQQKVYPQAAYARGASPQRSQSPKPHMHPEEHYVKVPVHHEQPSPKADTPSRPQQRQPPQQQQPPPQQQQPPPQQQQAPPQQQVPPQPKQQTPSNDPITQILSIQTDVLNLMTEVENFTGNKKDKRYLFLDEMLTRNLIKLDNIETDGKENIRLARKEAIRCIQKCIAVLEAKAEKGGSTPQPQDVEMNENNENEKKEGEQKDEKMENGEVEMKEPTKEEEKAESTEQQAAQPQPQEEKKDEQKPQEENKEVTPPQEKAEVAQPQENKDAAPPQAADTRPDESKPVEQKQDEQKNQENVEKKAPKKGTKTVKKRDKSKDKKDAPKDSNKEEKVEEKKAEKESMQVDEKGDSQAMEVDGASASQ